MNTRADKTQENRSLSVANAVTQKQNGGEPNFQFVDNRPEAVAQRKLQEMANNSPQAKQADQLKAMADNYSIQNQVIQGKLIYQGEIYGSMQQLAGGMQGAFEAYMQSIDPDKRAKLDDKEKLYDLVADLAEVNLGDLGHGQEDKMREDVPMSIPLTDALNKIAEDNRGERCHEVADQMLKAFSLNGKVAIVYEIYTGDPETENPIMVMDSRVRNHYITVVDGKVYDSSTGATGVVLANYIAALQALNEGKPLERREAK